MTSESRSAKTREARARIEADVVREQNRIMVRDKEETNYQWIYRLLNNWRVILILIIFRFTGLAPKQ